MRKFSSPIPFNKENLAQLSNIKQSQPLIIKPKIIDKYESVIKENIQIKIEESQNNYIKPSPIKISYSADNSNRLLSVAKEALQARRMSRKNSKIDDLNDLNIKIEFLENEKNRIQQEKISNLDPRVLPRSKSPLSKLAVFDYNTSITELAWIKSISNDKIIHEDTNMIIESPKISRESSGGNNDYFIPLSIKSNQKAKMNTNSLTISEFKSNNFLKSIGTFNEPVNLDEIPDLSPISNNSLSLKDRFASNISPNLLDKAREHKVTDSKTNNFSYALKCAGIDEKFEKIKAMNSSVFENDDFQLRDDTKSSIDNINGSEKKSIKYVDLTQSTNKLSHFEKKKRRENYQLDIIRIEDDNIITCSEDEDEDKDKDESLLYIMDLESKFLPLDNFPTPQSSKTINQGQSHPTENPNPDLQTAQKLSAQLLTNTYDHPHIIDQREEIIIDASDNEDSLRKQSKIIDLDNIISENDCTFAIEKVIDCYLQRNEGKIRTKFNINQTIRANLSQRLQKIIVKKVNIDQSEKLESILNDISLPISNSNSVISFSQSFSDSNNSFIEKIQSKLS